MGGGAVGGGAGGLFGMNMNLGGAEVPFDEGGGAAEEMGFDVLEMNGGDWLGLPPGMNLNLNAAAGGGGGGDGLGGVAWVGGGGVGGGGGGGGAGVGMDDSDGDEDGQALEDAAEAGNEVRRVVVRAGVGERVAFVCQGEQEERERLWWVRVESQVAPFGRGVTGGEASCRGWLAGGMGYGGSRRAGLCRWFPCGKVGSLSRRRRMVTVFAIFLCCVRSMSFSFLLSRGATLEPATPSPFP